LKEVVDNLGLLIAPMVILDPFSAVAWFPIFAVVASLFDVYPVTVFDIKAVSGIVFEIAPPAISAPASPSACVWFCVSRAFALFCVTDGTSGR
jgi:hypothetical protein